MVIIINGMIIIINVVKIIFLSPQYPSVLQIVKQVNTAMKLNDFCIIKKIHKKVNN